MSGISKSTQAKNAHIRILDTGITSSKYFSIYVFPKSPGFKQRSSLLNLSGFITNISLSLIH